VEFLTHRSSVGFGDWWGDQWTLPLIQTSFGHTKQAARSYEAMASLFWKGQSITPTGSNIQVLVNPGLAVGLNAGAAEIYGIDLGMSYMPAEGLTLALSGNVNSAKLKDIPPQVSGAVVGDLFENGQRLPFVPAYNVTVSGDYERPIGSHDLKAFGRISYTQTAGQFSNEIKGGAQNILSARLGFRNDRWSASIFGDNLLAESDPVYNRIELAFGRADLGLSSANWFADVVGLLGMR